MLFLSFSQLQSSSPGLFFFFFFLTPGPCYVQLGLKGSHLYALTSHREPSSKATTSSFSYCNKNLGKCSSRGGTQTAEMCSFPSHCGVVIDRKGRWGRGAFYYWHRCRIACLSLSLHSGSVIWGNSAQGIEDSSLCGWIACLS